MKGTNVKYAVIAVLGIIILANSVYFKPLDQKLNEDHIQSFDAEVYVDELWDSRLVRRYDSATNFLKFMSGLQTNPNQVFDSLGQTLGIGNVRYFRVKGEGQIIAINENDVNVQMSNGILELETEFIFGNAIRDASGLISINDFINTTDLNLVSETINKRIRKFVIPPFRSKVKEGDSVAFTGAIELNQKHLHLDTLEIIPVSIEIY